MAWRYCIECDAPLPYPTVEQILDPTEYTCYRCHAASDPAVTKERLILDLSKRIERIEQHLWPTDED